MWRRHTFELLAPLRPHMRWNSSAASRVKEVLEVASATDASKSDVERLHEVLDQSKGDLTFEDTVNVLGPLGRISKVHGPPSSSILYPIFEQIGPELSSNKHFLNAGDGENLRSLCQSLVDLRTFHAPVLGELSDFLQNLIERNGQQSVLCNFDVAADCLYALSFLRKSAPDVFRALLEVIDDENYIAHHTLDSASKINWAYLAQGVERPKSTLKVFMRRMFEHSKDSRLPFQYISEFSQLVESFNDLMGFEDVHKLMRETYIAKSPDVKFLERLGPLAKSQLVVMNVSSLKGFMPLCGLISKETPRKLVRFPRNRVPEHMTSRLPDSLGVYASTVVFLQGDQILEPINEVTGVVKRRLSMMKTSGWHFEMVRMSDIQHMEGEELDTFIVDKMEEALTKRRVEDAAKKTPVSSAV
eukprot:scpid7770/ scgid28171/ 